MKKRYILLVLVIALVAIFVVKKEMTDAPVVTEEVSVEQARTLCYVWNTEAGDNASLSMTFTGEGGKDVKGFFNWYPAQTDSKTGTFTGVAGAVDPKSMARTAELWWEAHAEGTVVTEELRVVFGEGTAQVGFGMMRDRGDGVYVYQDVNALSYVPALQQTDCEDPAMKKTY